MRKEESQSQLHHHLTSHSITFIHQIISPLSPPAVPLSHDHIYLHKPNPLVYDPPATVPPSVPLPHHCRPHPTAAASIIQVFSLLVLAAQFSAPIANKVVQHVSNRGEQNPSIPIPMASQSILSHVYISFLAHVVV